MRVNKELFREACEILSSQIAIDDYLVKEGHVGYRLQEYTTMIRCPFPDHDDSTPSFSFDVSKGLFNCFGCGRGGDIVNLHYHFNKIEDDRYTRVRAIRELSKEYKVKIPDVYNREVQFEKGRVNKYKAQKVNLDNIREEVYREKIKGYLRRVKVMNDVNKKIKIYRWVDDMYLELRGVKEVFDLIRGELR